MPLKSIHMISELAARATPYTKGQFLPLGYLWILTRHYLLGYGPNNQTLTHYILTYVPSVPGAAVCGGFYLALGVTLLYVSIKHKTWWGLCLPIGALCQSRR